ncbi:MAG: F0F1 ATP synthase subunit A [Lachnospiraceae bacterium]|nr:F0F1 ATP synthase subunit A [Lachnospiraceae bacterium]
MIKLFKEIKIGNTTVYITSTHVCLVIVTLIIMIFGLVVNRKIKAANAEDTPGTIQNIAEMIMETIENMVKGIMGTNAKRFVNYIAALFMFVLLSNISGLFGLRPPTADYGVTLPLGLITFFLIQYNGIKTNKTRHFTDLFRPIWFLFPINIIGEFAVPLSLSLRLFGNVMSGTVLMGLIYGLLPRLITIGVPSVLHVYFDIFSGCIQAYVICMLTMVYITDKIGD